MLDRAKSNCPRRGNDAILCCNAPWAGIDAPRGHSGAVPGPYSTIQDSDIPMSKDPIDNRRIKESLLKFTEESVMELAETMLFLDITPGHGLVKPAGVAHIPARAEASAMVGLSGGINGGVRLACSQNVALHLSSALFGERLNILEGEAKDAFAELANIIAGGIQTRMSTLIGDVTLSPPTVIVGADYEVEYKSQLESLRYFFRIESEVFYIEVHFLLDSQVMVNVSLNQETAALLDQVASMRNLGREPLLFALLDQERRRLNDPETSHETGQE
ncbi:MAG: chemotaxis protein CheX [Magnetococcus sp. WYHC-3]